MKKQFLKVGIVNIVILLSALFFFTSCEEKITYGWSDISESLGMLHDVRKDLTIEISNLEAEGYDVSELEDIDNRLNEVECVLGEKFH